MSKNNFNSEKIRFGLQLKMNISVSLMLILIMFSVGYFSVLREERLIIKKARLSGNILSHAFSVRVTDAILTNNFALLMDYVRDICDDGSVRYAMILDDEGMCLAHSDESNCGRRFSDRITKNVIARKREFFEYIEKEKYLDITKPVLVAGDIRGVIRLGFSLEEMHLEISRIYSDILVMTLVAIFIGIITAGFLSKIILQPINQLTKRVSTLASGNLLQKINIGSKDEIGLLGKHFNEMTEKLHDNMSQLQKRIFQLEVLREISSSMTARFDVDELLKIVLKKISSVMDANKASIILLDDNSNYQIKASAGFEEGDNNTKIKPKGDCSLLRKVIDSKAPLLVNSQNFRDFFIEEDQDNENSDYKSYSFISVPIISSEKVMGVISISDKDDNEDFEEDELRMLTIISSQIVTILESAEAYEKEIYKKKMERELDIAHEIQMNMLPEKFPPVKNVRIAAFSRPAKSVGGDYFDLIPVSDTHTAITIGDVSGKGIPAALLMVMVRAILRTQVLFKKGPEEIIKMVNQFLVNNSRPGMYITLFLGILNNETGEFIYSNGGHNYPLIYHSSENKFDILETTGMFVGMFEEAEFESKTVKLNSGDVLVGYTDGITEALNSSGEMYTLKKLRDLITIAGKCGVESLKQLIIEDVEKFSAGTEQSDDLTMILAEYLPES